MNVFRERWLRRPGAGALLETVWPAISSTDSVTHRKKKVAVRCAQLAVMMMVIVPVTATIITGYGQMSFLRISGLVLASPICIAWSLYGMHDVLRRLFRNQAEALAPTWTPHAPLGPLLYFVIQLSLAGLICYLSGDEQGQRLAWLVLLLPVAHSIILLRWPGVVCVSLLSVVLLAVTVAAWYGWKYVPGALLGFSFALLFTLVFTLLSVSSEKSRVQMERLAGELRAANGKLREYAVQAGELAATRERNRLAREIHDSLGHYLTVVNIQLEAARALWERDPVRARDALAKAQSFTREGLQDIRRSVTALRASPLDNQPLTGALRQLVAESNAAGVVTEMEVLGEPRTLPPPAELTLYRAGQEGLTNARKHARAALVRLVLDFRAAAQTRLRVSDNGVGAPPDPAGGFGLLGLRERAHLLGGELLVQTALQAGFTLEVSVPG